MLSESFIYGNQLVPEYVLSSRGKKILLLAGHYYYCNKTKTVSNQIKRYWICTQRTQHQCNAMVHTINDIDIKIIKGHNHEARAYSSNRTFFQSEEHFV